VLFNVPFLPDANYTDFLVSHQDRIHSVHFPLYDDTLKDARIDLDKIPLQSIVNQLRRLKHQKKYLLANARIHTSTLYSNKEAFLELRSKLEYLIQEDALDGIIFADSYMLVALGKALPSIANQLEAVPSINFGISSAEHLHVLVEFAETAGFRQPAKITLDRALNRQPKALKQLTRSIKRDYPDVTIELLANEGCINHCPFRSTHESMISMANLLEDCGGYDTHRINTSLACRKILFDEPHRFFASPFIRPEDTDMVSACGIDLIKLCGRTLGPQFLLKCLRSYCAGRHDGNLIDLMDASNWMGQHFYVDNKLLPDNFYALISSCTNHCSSCSICRLLFENSAHPVEYHLRDLRKE